MMMMNEKEEIVVVAVKGKGNNGDDDQELQSCVVKEGRGRGEDICIIRGGEETTSSTTSVPPVQHRNQNQNHHNELSSNLCFSSSLLLLLLLIYLIIIVLRRTTFRRFQKEEELYYKCIKELDDINYTKIGNELRLINDAFDFFEIRSKQIDDVIKQKFLKQQAHVSPPFIYKGRERIPVLEKNVHQHIIIQYGMEEIPNEAFQQARLSSSSGILRLVSIPPSVQVIGSNAFAHNYELTNVRFIEIIINNDNNNNDMSKKKKKEIKSSQLITIGSEAFYGCTKLESFHIPSTVTSIGRRAFSGCTELESIHIPSTVKSIGSHAFSRCISFVELTLPEGLTEIHDWTFCGCTKLESFHIPSTVKSIGSHAFSYCFSLVELTLPEGLTEIDESAFSGCSSLKSIQLPSTLRKIGRQAFEDCALESLSIPKSIERIGPNAFYGCKQLKEVIFTSRPNLDVMGCSVFDNCPELKVISIPPAPSAPAATGLEHQLEDGATNHIHHHRFSFHPLRYCNLPGRWGDNINIVGINAGFVGTGVVTTTNNNDDQTEEVVTVVRGNGNFYGDHHHQQQQQQQNQPTPPSHMFDDFLFYKDIRRNDNNNNNNSINSNSNSIGISNSNSNTDSPRTVDIDSICLVSRLDADADEYYITGFQVTYRSTNGCTTTTGGVKIPGHNNNSANGQNDHKMTKYLNDGEYILGLRVFFHVTDTEHNNNDIRNNRVSGITVVTNYGETHMGGQSTESHNGRSGYYDPHTLMIQDVGYPTTSFTSRIVALASTCGESGFIDGIGCYVQKYIWFYLVRAKVCMELRWLWKKGRAVKANSKEDDDATNEDDIVVKVMEIDSEDLFRNIVKFLD